MTDEPDNLVLAHLRKLDTKIDRIANELTFVRATVGGHTRVLNDLRNDVLSITAAVNDVASTDITSGEVRALHNSLNRLQQGFDELEARVTVIEVQPHD